MDAVGLGRARPAGHLRRQHAPASGTARCVSRGRSCAPPRFSVAALRGIFSPRSPGSTTFRSTLRFTPGSTRRSWRSKARASGSATPCPATRCWPSCSRRSARRCRGGPSMSIEAGAPLDAEQCELAAELARAAGDRRRAGDLLLEWPATPSERGALVSAEATLERALTWAPAADPLVADIEECLVDVLSMAGKRDRAVEVGDSLLRRLGTTPDLAGRRGEVGLRLARVAVAAARWDDARAALAQARGRGDARERRAPRRSSRLARGARRARPG